MMTVRIKEYCRQCKERVYPLDFDYDYNICKFCLKELANIGVIPGKDGELFHHSV
jgi:ribosomal protein S14